MTAHELGTSRTTTILKRVGWLALFLLPAAALVALFTRRRGGLARPEAVPVALFVFVALQLLTMPLTNIVSRREEAEADWSALNATRDPAAARALFRNLATTSLANPDPPTWTYVLYEDHPTIVQRIANPAPAPPARRGPDPPPPPGPSRALPPPPRPDPSAPAAAGGRPRPAPPPGARRAPGRATAPARRGGAGGRGTERPPRALLAAGFDVVAVEPQPSLREVLAASIGSERALDGLAEAIPLGDGSVDAVTVADAFHWFDQIAALAEIRRVLRPEGGLALLTTLPDFGGASWAHELGTLLERARPEHPGFDGPPWRDSIELPAAGAPHARSVSPPHSPSTRSG